ncbi:MAG TPA: dipicolinate synthase subunit B [Clostridia bacterium]|nr:dipicolinate synthase subunit B [Clostridia bacterium]
MRLAGVKIGVAITGSHCTLAKVLRQVQTLVEEGATVYPIVSDVVAETDTRFGQAREWLDRLKDITGQEAIKTIVDAEPIGPQSLLDVILVAPCTGNTLAKLANGITDSPVLMAIKAHLRNQKPVVIAISTNDALGMNAKNLGLLLNAKHIFFVPFGQDSPLTKPQSLVAHMEQIVDTILAALQGKQIQPLLVEHRR